MRNHSFPSESAVYHRCSECCLGSDAFQINYINSYQYKRNRLTCFGIISLYLHWRVWLLFKQTLTWLANYCTLVLRPWVGNMGSLYKDYSMKNLELLNLNYHPFSDRNHNFYHKLPPEMESISEPCYRPRNMAEKEYFVVVCGEKKRVDRSWHNLISTSFPWVRLICKAINSRVRSPRYSKEWTQRRQKRQTIGPQFLRK